ncbi:HTH CENPB-type domain-containing protein [Nephila pilipes]|uniref:HTH CENPB-type domain-containing protein n=1 Tax=Nephila pilipes TaxID=299642 RepID=A0A8X6NV64_NEPPI|nr:HTH CENPB-type domain-containing protein [Nephila pilipes]
MDNSDGHSADLYHKGVQIDFLPPITTSLLQPMNQQMIRAFKALFTRNCLQLFDAIDEEEDFHLKGLWCNFRIFSNAIDSAMSTYKTLFITMKKRRSQLPITMFLTKVKKSNQATPEENTAPFSYYPGETTPPPEVPE